MNCSSDRSRVKISFPPGPQMFKVSRRGLLFAAFFVRSLTSLSFADAYVNMTTFTGLNPVADCAHLDISSLGLAVPEGLSPNQKLKICNDSSTLQLRSISQGCFPSTSLLLKMTIFIPL